MRTHVKSKKKHIQPSTGKENQEINRSVVHATLLKTILRQHDQYFIHDVALLVLSVESDRIHTARNTVAERFASSITV